MRRFDIIAFLSVLTCVVFVVGLTDVPLRRPITTAVAPPPPASVTERDGRLELRVTRSSDQTPLGDATVRVLWERDGRYYLAGRGSTDSGGRITLEDLPRGAAWVLTEARGHARSSTQVVIDDQGRLIEVELAEAHELAVSVSDEQGAPIANATVLVTTGDPLPFGALTDPRGAVRFDRLGAPPWTVKASAPGYESVTRSGVTGDVTIALRRLGSLEVRVEMPDGRPAVGATILIAGSTLWPARRAETDESGSVRIAGLLAGSYDLRATLGELVAPTLFGVELERGEDDSVTLRLAAGRMVRAIVTDGDEEDALVVPGADVVLAEAGLSSFPMRGRTGSDGSVLLGPIGSGPATLAARAPDFVASPAVAVPEPLEGPVRVPLVRGGTLLGEVVDTRDRPVDGASIEVIGTDRNGLPISETPVMLAYRQTHFEWALSGPAPLIPAGELGVMPGPIPPIPPPGAAIVPGGAGTVSLFAPSDAAPEASVEPWVTRWDGTFTARPVTPGRVRALVRHPAYVEGVSDVVVLAPGGEAKVKVVLRAGGNIEGRVVDEHGRPQDGVRVDLTALRGTLERTTITASDGSFAFAAVPEEVLLSVARPEDLSRIVLKKSVLVKEGETTEVEITLPAERDSVEVLVTADGDPVDAAQVTLLSLDPSAPYRQTLFTGSEGLVTMPDARGLDLRVQVEAPGFTRATKTVKAAPERITIALSRGAIVTGRVTAIRGRTYLSGASVTLVSDGRRTSALTDNEGVFTLRDIAPGPAKLLVSHPEYANAELDVTIERPARADRPFELETVDLAEPSSVEGEVLDASGKPVSGARVGVGVVPAYLPAGSLPSGMAITDSKGRFKLLGVAPGPTELEAYAPDVGRGRVRVDVSGGRPTTGVSIRLAAGSADDDPTPGASIAITLGERDTPEGTLVVVVQVAAGSEAERSGIRQGDVISAVDGVAVDSMSEARARLSGPNGSDVVIALVRGGAELQLRVAREAVRR